MVAMCPPIGPHMHSSVKFVILKLGAVALFSLCGGEELESVTD